MAAFEYQALDPGGRTQSGVLQADTPRAARALLRERGLTPLDVTAVREKAAVAPLPWTRRGISRAQLAVLSRQLATLVGAGLPMDESLQALAEAADGPKARAIVVEMRSRVMEGQSLAAALGEFPDSFPDSYRAAVAAGEASGRLDTALARLADDAESREALARQVVAALAYPVLLTVVALSIVTGLLVYVVPKIVGVFQNLNQTLPWITRVLIAVADAVRAWGFAALVLLVVGTIGFGYALRREPVRAAWDRFVLRLPLIGRLVRSANTARLTRTLATLTASGVPVLDAMQLALPTVKPVPMQQALRRATARVREGGAFARSLEESGQFPPVAVRLIASGEKSGRLDAMLEEAARHQSREVESWLTALAGILGPGVILLVGGLVLFIVLAILLPIFELNTLIK